MSSTNILKIPTYTIEIIGRKNVDMNLLFELLEEIWWDFSIVYHRENLLIKIRPVGEIGGKLMWFDIDLKVINAIKRIEATGFPSFRISCRKKPGLFSLTLSFYQSGLLYGQQK